MIVMAWSFARALSIDVALGGACGASLAPAATGAPLSHVATNERYRVVGDLVFLLGVVPTALRS